MTATYEITLKLTVIAPVDKIDENLKSDTELATDICQMICDEGCIAGNVVTYEIIDSSIDVR